MKYTVLVSEDIRELIKEVNDFFKLGWHCQ